MDKNKAMIQMTWGVALAATGIGLFFRIPQVMPRIAEIEPFSSSMGLVKFCFYLIGILLLGGGLRKTIGHFKIIKGAKNNPS